MINDVTIAGNLTRDIDLRQTQGGTTIANFGIAVNERVKNNQTGEWSDRPNFFNCVCFGRRAEGLAKVLRKGQKVAISGHLRHNQWENDKGEKRSNVEIVVDDVEFMSQRNDSQSQPNGSYGQQYQQQPNYSQQQQYAHQNAPQQPTGGYQQQGYQQQAQQPDLASYDLPF